ncbi:MAG: hypothetical protein LBN94_00900 [Puniceicoccales bacterium]|nr:hypothetical protein [Puniceicoccales bacterium]
MGTEILSTFSLAEKAGPFEKIRKIPSPAKSFPSFFHTISILKLRLNTGKKMSMISRKNGTESFPKNWFLAVKII